MNRPATAPCNSTSPSPSRPCQGPDVDHAATQRMLAGAFAATANPRQQEVTATQ